MEEAIQAKPFVPLECVYWQLNRAWLALLWYTYIHTYIGNNNNKKKEAWPRSWPIIGRKTNFSVRAGEMTLHAKQSRGDLLAGSFLPVYGVVCKEVSCFPSGN